MFGNFFTFSRFTLFVALCISSIAAWYSVLGLATIFSGAKIPIIVMGSILEIAKITTTVWLHHYWDRASWSIKTYLTGAVVALAFLTSMGIFGLLSKAHSDTGLVSGEVQAQLALFDEKIRTQRDNIEVARKALQQMDSQVDARLARGDTEAGAERAVQIRRQQAPERARLQREIADAQKAIAKLNEERAPIAAQNRKVEAEVGPIKYIAALIYGDNPDQNLLERAVRWVTILIVIVFDPLAIILILAANNSLRWEREERIKKVDDRIGELNKSIDDAEQILKEPDRAPETPPEPNFSQGNYSVNYTLGPVDFKTLEPVTDHVRTAEQNTSEQPAVIWPTEWKEAEPLAEHSESAPIETSGVTKQAEIFHPTEQYVTYQGKVIHVDALKQIRPDMVLSPNSPINEIMFGHSFPAAARSGDIYIRIDQNPHRVFKFNSIKWIEIDRGQNNTYLQSTAYVQYLISKIDSGEIDIDLLTEAEQEEIRTYLNKSV